VHFPSSTTKQPHGSTKESLPKKRGTESDIAEIIKKETTGALRRKQVFGTPPFLQKGANYVVVDDGIATGATLLLTLRELTSRNVGTVHVVCPLAKKSALDFLNLHLKNGTKVVFHVFKVIEDEEFGFVGRWYHDFGDVPDEACLTVLSRAQKGEVN
jgi:putative phosphoribosyl transferase